VGALIRASGTVAEPRASVVDGFPNTTVSANVSADPTLRNVIENQTAFNQISPGLHRGALADHHVTALKKRRHIRKAWSSDIGGSEISEAVGTQPR
jgi:hypothetical protein